MERYINTHDDLTLWTESMGNSDHPAVLLIMGATCQGIMWPDRFCSNLVAAGYFVIRFDFRDTGQSSTIDFEKNPYQLSDLKSDVLDILNAYKIYQANIIGWSMGGYVAQLLAIEDPKRVNKLILLSSSADQRPFLSAILRKKPSEFSLPAPQQSYLDFIFKRFSQATASEKQTRDIMLQAWQAMDAGLRKFPLEKITKILARVANRSRLPAAAFQHIAAMDNSEHRLKKIKHITAETLIIHGRYDPCLPLEHGYYLFKNIRRSQLTILDMGHMFQWSWSDEVFNNIKEFFSISSVTA